MCKYNYAETLYETKVCEKSKEPSFNYVAEHMTVITDDMIQHLMYNTLTVGVYGMIESKRAKKSSAADDHDEEEFNRTLKRLKTKVKFESTGNDDFDKRILQLEDKNA